MEIEWIVNGESGGELSWVGDTASIGVIDSVEGLKTSFWQMDTSSDPCQTVISG
jgi:hypothetical protein